MEATFFNSLVSCSNIMAVTLTTLPEQGLEISGKSCPGQRERERGILLYCVVTFCCARELRHTCCSPSSSPYPRWSSSTFVLALLLLLNGKIANAMMTAMSRILGKRPSQPSRHRLNVKATPRADQSVLTLSGYLALLVGKRSSRQAKPGSESCLFKKLDQHEIFTHLSDLDLNWLFLYYHNVFQFLVRDRWPVS